MFPTASWDWLREIVSINSGTRNVEGVRTVQRRVAPRLEALGFQTEWIENPDGASVSAPLLVARWNVGARNPVATLVGHADTVFEPSHGFQNFEAAPDGKTARGPGIIDDKGSLAVGLEALRQFFAAGAVPAGGLGLQFLCSPNEELGSPGFHALFRQLAKRSSVVFGLEPALESGDIVVKRKGGRWYRVEIEGREAHAGRAHAEGLNAGHELALKTDRLEKLTDYRRGTTVNLGSFEGGDGKYNVVCGHATGRFDIRYETAAVERTLFPKIERILKTPLLKKGTRRARAQFFIEDRCPPLEPRPDNLPWIEAYRRALKPLERRAVRPGASGGGSDSSHFSRPGLPVLDGLGACGGRIHTDQEFLVVESLTTRATALAALLAFARTRLA